MSGWISHDGFLSPTLTLGTQVVIRRAYGVLLLLTIVQAATQWRRFFCSERWGGYTQTGPLTDWIQSPRASWIAIATWTASALGLAFDVEPVWCALINVVVARYFFVHLRWRSVLRGMGAPGFFTYWLGAVVFLLELTTRFAPHARPIALLVAQMDFAFIMLSAGIYKFTAGYASNDGMDYGLVNPEWGYWWRAYRKLNPDHVVFHLLNHLAWATEVLAALLMMVPATRFVGALLLLVSFVFIALNIRLGWLCEMVIASTLLFFFDGNIGSQIIGAVAPGPVVASISPGDVSPLLRSLLETYLVLLPVAHAGLFFNFYGRRRLPGFLQRAFDKYTNAFGLIIWRVFSVDVINFYILVHRQKTDEPTSRVLLSKYGWRGGFRFSHVGESIAITSVFTTLKYYPSNSALFQERLRRYARTIPCARGDEVVFQYLSILKNAGRFGTRAVAEYRFEPGTDRIDERLLDPSFSVRAPHPASPVQAGTRPGTYVPAGAR